MERLGNRGGRRPYRPTQGAEPLTDLAAPEGSRRYSMQRGVTQLLFNYLPGRTVDWEDGLAIVQLGRVRLSHMWEDERATVLLDEIALLLDRWRTRGGTVHRHFPDPRVDRGRFAIGLPEAIEATVLESALLCQHCSRLVFLGRSALADNQRPLSCPECNRPSLRQFGQVFVHGCGALVPLTEWIPWVKRSDDGNPQVTNIPLRCQRCGDRGRPAMPARSERVRDMRVVCRNCNFDILERLTARCHDCFNRIMAERAATQAGSEASSQSAEATLVTRIAMRMTRYSASDTYYPQSLTMLRLDRPRITTGGDPERTLLRQLIPETRRPGAASGLNTLAALFHRVQVAEREGDTEEVARLRIAIAQEALNPSPPDPVSLSPDLVIDDLEVERTIMDSLAFRESISSRSALSVAQSSGGVSAFLSDSIDRTRRALGLRETSLVDDLPVITATYGFTRRSFEPTYQELSSNNLPTQIRPFSSLDRTTARIHNRPDKEGAVPILAREGEHEGLFVSLEPEHVVRWLEMNGTTLPLPGREPIARILHALEPVDRYYDDVWDLPVRRMVFGLVHSLSHAVMRAVSRYAGLERTSISEYIFLPLLGTVVFDNSSSFRLGGIETLVRDQLSAFLATLAEETMSCLYDPACIDDRGACHGCLHSPEISCRVFNHGLSRAFLIGGHPPWKDIATADRVVGFWTIGT